MKIGILGYGKLGRGVHLAAAAAKDTEKITVFTKRDPAGVLTDEKTPVVRALDIEKYKNDVDILFVTHKSLSDLPREVPSLLRNFSTVDAMDGHDAMREYRENCHAAAKENGTVAVVGAGWDPGLLSVSRVLFHACFPTANVHTFWGFGVSEGHSTAIRNVPGVRQAVSYTKPNDEAKYLVSLGKTVEERKKHKRICYVVADGKDHERIRGAILRMPFYFEGYDTEVIFQDEETFFRDHGQTPHKGQTFLRAATGVSGENAVKMGMTLEMGSNPEFTGSVLLAYGRAAFRLRNEGAFGAYSPVEIPPSYLLGDITDLYRFT